MTVSDSYLENTLPPGLQGNLSTIKTGVTQWSRIVAWSWCDYLAFKGDEQKEEQEQSLKDLLIYALKMQAQHSDAYTSYGDPNSKSEAEAWGEAMINLLLGKTKEVPGGEEINLTLSDVIQKITGQPLITSMPENEKFAKSFFVRVITDSFTGKITEAPEGLNKPYINFIAYPPRPELSELTITEEQLEFWASNPSPLPGGNYLPPSVYVPTAFT